MSNIVRSTGSPSGLSRYEDRLNTRAVARMGAHTEIELARIEHKAVEQAAKVDAVGFVTVTGMHRVAMISEVEQQLAKLSPLGISRVEAIANFGALGIAEVVADTVRKVR